MRLEDLDTSKHGRLASPSADRNKGFIAEVLSQVLPQSGLVLEIASGTGQHVVHFARAMPHLTWQPSERDSDCLLIDQRMDRLRGPAECAAAGATRRPGRSVADRGR